MSTERAERGGRAGWPTNVRQGTRGHPAAASVHLPSSGPFDTIGTGGRAPGRSRSGTRGAVVKKPLPLGMLAAFVATQLVTHFAWLSWDFSAFILNARYLFAGGRYYEPFRPPLVPVLLAPEAVIGPAAHVLYIAGVSLLLFYSAARLSRAAFRDRRFRGALDRRSMALVVLVFLLNGFASGYAFSSGSELLWTAFACLFLADLLRGRTSGHWLGLAFLTRANTLAFAPMLLLARPRTILKNVGLFAAVSAPWLLWMELRYHNPLAGVADAVIMNILSGRRAAKPVAISHFLLVGGWGLPLAVAGLAVAAVVAAQSARARRSLASPRIAVPAVFAIFAAIAVRQFTAIPFRTVRYLYPFVIPVAFFAALGAAWLLDRARLDPAFWRPALAAVFLVTMVGVAARARAERRGDDAFYAAAGDMDALGLSRGRVLSHYWVPMHYLRGNAYPLLPDDLGEAIDRGEVVLVFKRPYLAPDPDYPEERLAGLPRLLETKDYVFLGRRGAAQPGLLTCDTPCTGGHLQAIADTLPEGPARVWASRVSRLIDRSPARPKPVEMWRSARGAPGTAAAPSAQKIP